MIFVVQSSHVSNSSSLDVGNGLSLATQYGNSQIQVLMKISANNDNFLEQLHVVQSFNFQYILVLAKFSIWSQQLSARKSLFRNKASWHFSNDVTISCTRIVCFFCRICLSARHSFKNASGIKDLVAGLWLQKKAFEAQSKCLLSLTT